LSGCARPTRVFSASTPKAKAVDEFIDTITRTSIFSGLSREELARGAGKLDEARRIAGRRRGQRPLVAGARPQPMTAE